MAIFESLLSFGPCRWWAHRRLTTRAMHRRESWRLNKPWIFASVKVSSSVYAEKLNLYWFKTVRERTVPAWLAPALSFLSTGNFLTGLTVPWIIFNLRAGRENNAPDGEPPSRHEILMLFRAARKTHEGRSSSARNRFRSGRDEEIFVFWNRRKF